MMETIGYQLIPKYEILIFFSKKSILKHTTSPLTLLFTPNSSDMKRPTLPKLLLSLLISILWLSGSSQLYAQQAQGLQPEWEGEQASERIDGARFLLEGKDTRFPAVVIFYDRSTVPVGQFFGWLKRQVFYSYNIDFVLLSDEKDEWGFTHLRYVQTYKGLPIDGTLYHLRVKGDQVVAFNGVALEPADLPVNQGLSEKQALQMGLSYMGAKIYAWEQPHWEKDLQEQNNDPNATYYPEGQLCWMPSSPQEGDQGLRFTLCYRFDIQAASPWEFKRIYVDAQSGEIRNDLPMESNCSAATVNTVFNGNRNIRTQEFLPGIYRLRDNCTSSKMRVRDWNSTTTTHNAVDIINTDNLWTNMNERFGGSVLWATKRSYRYFQNVHSRNSYDNSGGNVNGFINAVFGCGMNCSTTNNASMSFTGGRMKVGLGSSGTLANCFGTLDIVAHEYTHAVTGATSALVYERESGALNESFSDIFAEVVERWATGTNDWLLGDERTNGAIRSMEDPNIYGHPDTYQGTNWVSTTSATCNNSNDNCGVHINSGVMNYWFFLLTEGGSGTNDNGDEYCVEGIGISKARVIAYQNMITLTPNDGYSVARSNSISIAEGLYGVCSDEAIQVRNAWHAVGVGAAGAPVGEDSNFPAVCSGELMSISMQDYIKNDVAASFQNKFNYSAVNYTILGPSVNVALTNKTSSTVNVDITVTPWSIATGCQGPDFTVTMTVHPEPNSSDDLQVVCSETRLNINLQDVLDANGNGLNSSFKWRANNKPAVSGETTSWQYSSTIDDSLVNNTLSNKTVVYRVVPTSTAHSCEGDEFLVKVRVKPRYYPDFILPDQGCNGGKIDLAAWVSDPNGKATSYTFYDEDPIANPGATPLGTVSATNGVVNSIITHPNNWVGVTLHHSVQTYWVQSTVPNGCPGTTSSSIYIPSLIAHVDPVPDIVVNDGDPVNINFTGTNLSFTFWQNLNMAPIGLIGNLGLNNIAFTANNPGPSPVTAQMRVTSYHGNCWGNQELFNITVNPAPAPRQGRTNELVLNAFKANEHDVKLQWHLRYDQPLTHFEVEKKLGDGEFESIAQVASLGMEGNYSYLDRGGMSNLTTYRIKLVHEDGRVIWSDEVEVHFDFFENDRFTVFPNPSNGRFVLRALFPLEESWNWQILDLTGRLMDAGKLNQREMGIDITHFPSGIYHMVLTNKEGKRYLNRVIKK